MMNKPKLVKILIVLIFLIGITSRFINIRTQGILIDETWVVPTPACNFDGTDIYPKLFGFPQYTELPDSIRKLIKQIYYLHPIFQISARSAVSDVHPPLFYILNYYWSRMFGYAIEAIRFPAAIYFLIAMVVLWLFLKKQGMNDRIVLYTLGLVALSPLYLFFSNFARPYTLMLLLCLGSSYMAYRMAMDRYDIKKMGLYILLAILAAYTHYYALIVVVTQAIYLITESCLSKKYGTLKDIVIIYLIMFILYLPWMIVMVLQIMYRHNIVQVGFHYFTLRSFTELLLFFGTWYSRSTMFSTLNIVVSCLEVLLLISGIIYAKRNIQNPALRFWVIFLIIPFVMIAISNRLIPVFTPRNCSIILIPYLVIIGIGIETIKKKMIKTAVIVFIGILGIISDYHSLTYGNTKGKGAMEDWKSAGGYISNYVEKELPVYVYYPSYREALYYYIPDEKRIRRYETLNDRKGPVEKRFIFVLMRPEDIALEEQMERDVPFLLDSSQFKVQMKKQVPRIVIFEVERISQ